MSALHSKLNADLEWFQRAKRKSQSRARELTAARQRVGVGGKNQLNWLLGAISKPPRTPEELRHFKFEIAAFTDGLFRPSGRFPLPADLEARAILEDAKIMIASAAARKNIRARHDQTYFLHFQKVDGRFYRWEERDWRSDFNNELCRRILEAGHLIMQCCAPAPRSKEQCGRIFIATRPGKLYCSVKCSNRAVTRAWRKK